MRNHQKQQILDIIKTIREAQKAELYADCQEGALACCGFVESIIEYDSKIVKLLKNYCEQLYKVHTGELDKNVLKKSLYSIEMIAKSELKVDKIEVVFLPYKASMWDSLESVYLAAKADPDCDTYVVPIPSYELNPDGTLGKMYYDGDEYPKEITVTNWKEYDIETRQPDVIFTHYAYDNNVTNYSIHPEFYSKRLVKLCGRLINIPYFVAGENVDDYCAALPGVLYAHHVIVQSEKVRELYIEHYKSFDKRHDWNGRYGKAEDKFIALGSPKFDKVINTKREDCELPDEWKKLIIKPDGSIKKVVLYNTHMWSWLKGGERYFEKLRYVFDTFKSRDDVILWWRPHPNTESNFRVKRPELLGEYFKIVEEYNRDGFGIYDDTADLHRAIAWSDCYYGDGSSLTILYEITGKPIVCQDVETTYAFSELGARFPVIMSIYKNKLYYHSLWRNIIFEIDLSGDSLKPKYYSKFANIPVFNYDDVYGGLFTVGDELWFLPRLNNEIIIYNLKYDEYSALTLELKEDYKTKGKQNFRSLFVYEDIIYFVPIGYQAIVAYNLKTGETKHCIYLPEVFSEFSKLKNPSDKALFAGYEYLDKSKILLPTIFTNKILEFDLHDYSYVVHAISDGDVKFSGIAEYEGEFWIYARNCAVIYKWNYKENKVTKFSDFPKGLACQNLKFLFNIFSVKYENYLFIFPSFSNMVCRIDMGSGKIDKVEEFDKYISRKDGEEDVRLFLHTLIDNGNIYVSQKDGLILKYDIVNREISEIDVAGNLSDDDCRRLSNDCMNDLVFENELYASVDKPELDNLGIAGQVIYDTIKENFL